MKKSIVFMHPLLLLSAGFGLAACDRLTYTFNKGYMDEIAKKPHTAHILDYAVTFPKAAEIQDIIPGGLESGTEIGKSGDATATDGAAYTAKWEMAHGGGEVSFTVEEKGASNDVPEKLSDPWGFTRVDRTNKGTVDVAGIKFTIQHWTGDFKDAVVEAKNVSGVDYFGRDSKGNLVILRGMAFGTNTATEKITSSILKSLRIVPTKMSMEQVEPDKPAVQVPYEMI